LAKCVVCKKEQLGYEWTQTKNGKKWLFNKQLGRWHDCPKSTKSSEFMTKSGLNGKFTRDDYDFCEFCGKFMYKQSILEQYPSLSAHQNIQDHKAKWHPNGEIFDDVDFMALTEEDKEKKRIEWGRKKRESVYKMVGIFLE